MSRSNVLKSDLSRSRRRGAIVKSGTQIQEVSLADAFVPTLVRTDLSRGPHELEIKHAEPLVNHYLAVDVNEVVEDGGVVSSNEKRSVRSPNRELTRLQRTMSRFNLPLGGPS